MNKVLKLDEKVHQYLVYLLDKEDTKILHEFLIHSEIELERDWEYDVRSDFFEITFKVDPEIYKRFKEFVQKFANSIVSELRSISDIPITKIHAIPDLSKFQILNSRITPILTPWEEINKSQTNLLDQLRKSVDSQDFQNVGNTSRTTLQKLSDHIFDSAKHVPEDKSIDLSKGKFKNRLHTYIKSELAGKENKVLREYAESIVTTAEKSTDLANKLTHDLKATRIMAESCVISIISVISIIKLIAK